MSTIVNCYKKASFKSKIDDAEIATKDDSVLDMLTDHLI